MRRIVSIIIVAALALLSVVSFASVAVAQNGSIAGVVQTDNGTPISGAVVYAYEWNVDVAMGPTFAAGSDYTDEAGLYFILGLDTDDYRVIAHADGYFSEYYDDSATPAGALQVSVTDPNPTAGIDFALEKGGSISGFVYEEDGSTPVYPARIIAYDYTSGQMVDDAWTQADGSYIVGNNVVTGSYRVKAEADGYFTEYFQEVATAGAATQVTVTEPDDAGDIDFTLAEGGSISGVVESDNGTAIYGARVIAYDSVSGLIVDDGWSREDGTYTVGNNIADGTYQIRADMDGYFSEYYLNATTQGAATLVTVTAPAPNTDIDFSLTPGGSISGFVLQEGTGTPIYLARVIAYDAVSGLIVDDGWSRANGSYTIGNNLYDGDYKVAADATGFFSEYYDNVTSSDLATPVAVTAPTPNTGIDFTLSSQTLIFSNVAANVTGENTATITWTTDQPGTSMVEYGLALNDYPFRTTVDLTLQTSHSVDLTGLTRGTTYHYRVVSADAAENEGRSGDYTFITPDLTPPVISDVTAINITETGATITWTTDEPATSQIEYGTSAPGYANTTSENTTLVVSHSVDITGLTAGTTYHYKVKSRDTDGSGLWAESVDNTFDSASPPDVTAPVISGVTASGMTQTGATITWTTDEGSSSQVEYGTTDQYGTATTLDSTLVTSHSVALTGLTAGTTYHFRVKSTDAASNEAVSADYTFATTPATVADTTPPTTPVVTDDGVITTNLTQLHATWTSSDPESGIAAYEYAIGTSAGGNDTVDWTSAGTETSVTKTGLSLSAGTTYYFSVKAQNGEGLWSAIGTSNGITAEEETPEEPSDEDGGGMPTWAWILIGLGGGAAVGGAAYFLAKGSLLKKK
jgi:hypothetical protein